MNRFLLPLLTILCVSAASVVAQQRTVTVATVNIPGIEELKGLSAKFEEKNPEIKLEWVMVGWDELARLLPTYVASGSGRFDIVLIGQYETSIYSKLGLLQPLENLPADYDLEDVFKSLRDGLSFEGKLYALPFRGESSMLMYRKDLFEEKGLTMPEQPRYQDIAKLAAALTNKADGIYGITLRGRPGWGENMAYLGTLINTFGGAWFDMERNLTIDTPEWQKAITFYVDLLKSAGPPAAISYGFLENLNVFRSGKAAMWIDSTEAGSFLEDDKQSQVAGKIGYAPAPIEITPNGSHWLWSWAFAIPRMAKNQEAAQKFAEWATSKEYIKLVAGYSGWPSVPAGTRKSTYENAEFKAPYAAAILNAIQTADPTNPSIKKVPYNGIQFVDIPQFKEIGNLVGQHIARALAGETSVDEALKNSQIDVEHGLKTGEWRTQFPTPTAAPSPLATDKQCRFVFYATNRVRRTDASAANELLPYSYERTQDLTFGEAVVRVPENHKIGHIELPGRSFFGPIAEKEKSKDYFSLPFARELKKDDFLKEIGQDQKSSALFFVHGFNTGIRDALYELAQIVFDTNYDGVPIAFSWPSQGPIDILDRPDKAVLAYNYDRESVRYSQDAFLEVLRLVQTIPKVSKIYIIAHSLGNQLVINAIDEASWGGEKLSIAEMVLAAPDVDCDLFTLLGSRLKAAAGGITLYASSVDRALAFSTTINGRARAGFIPDPGHPFIFPGIQTIDCTALGVDMFWFFNHDTYKTTRSVLDDIGQIITYGTHVTGIRWLSKEHGIFPP